MKLLQQFILYATMVIMFTARAAWAGEDGLFVVYHLEYSRISGELSLRPVEIKFDTVTSPSYAVFTEWLRPYLHDKDQIELEQINKAYCKSLKIEIKNEKREHIDVFLDYSACKGKNKPTSAEDKVLEGIAAAIFYTENVPKVQPVTSLSLHVKGISNQNEITKNYAWTALQKKWTPYMAGFIDRCK